MNHLKGLFWVLGRGDEVNRGSLLEKCHIKGLEFRLQKGVRAVRKYSHPAKSTIVVSIASKSNKLICYVYE